LSLTLHNTHTVTVVCHDMILHLVD